MGCVEGHMFSLFYSQDISTPERPALWEMTTEMWEEGGPLNELHLEKQAWSSPGGGTAS